MSETVAPSGAHTKSRRRIWAVAVTGLVLGVAVTAGLLSSPDGGTPVIFVERVSSAISGLTSAEGSNVWWVYAFFLGIVAAFNPCGFALLPAYLGLYLNERTDMGLATRTRRSLAVSAVVAVAFTLLFGVTGAVFSLASSLIVRLLPWVGLGVGVLLIVAGGVSIGGKTLGLLSAVLYHCSSPCWARPSRSVVRGAPSWRSRCTGSGWPRPWVCSPSSPAS